MYIAMLEVEGYQNTHIKAEEYGCVTEIKTLHHSCLCHNLILAVQCGNVMSCIVLF